MRLLVGEHLLGFVLGRQILGRRVRAGWGVRINAVAPGPIATDRALEAADHVGPVLARIPSRRMSTPPQEVAAAVPFLAGDDAANIHGAVLSVDGGLGAV